MDEKIPTYRIQIDENDEFSGVDFISLVDEPAMELNWIKLSKLIEMDFIKSPSDKKMLYGVFIVPDKKIPRSDSFLEKYYTVFYKEDITKIVKKFNKNNFNKNINFMHGDNRVKGYVVENFQTSEMMKADFGYPIPDGSWVGSIYIEDDEFWNNYIKTDSLKGFSVEIGSFLVKTELSKSITIDKLYDEMNTILLSKDDKSSYDSLVKLFTDKSEYDHMEITKLLKSDLPISDIYDKLIEILN